MSMHDGVLPPLAARSRTFLGEPRALAYLAFTEAWERFSYYGMTALLVLYMTHALLLPGHVEHIAGFTGIRSALQSVFWLLSTLALASQIFGLYSGFVYFTPVFGSWIANRWIGQRNAVVLGALLMSGGHIAMAFDASFLLCGLLAQLYGWHEGFGLAGLLMLFGLATYLAGYRKLSESRRAHTVKAIAVPLDRAQWRIIAALCMVIAITMFQSIAYYQNSNIGLIWIDRSVDLDLPGFHLPVAWFNSIDSLVSVIAVPFLFALWRHQDRNRRVDCLHREFAPGRRLRGYRSRAGSGAGGLRCAAGSRVSVLLADALGAGLTRGTAALARHDDGHRVPEFVLGQYHHRLARRPVRSHDRSAVLGDARRNRGVGRHARSAAEPASQCRARIGLTQRVTGRPTPIR